MKLQLPALVMLLSNSSKMIQAGGALQGRTLTAWAGGLFNTGSAPVARARDSGRTPAVIGSAAFLQPGNFEQRAHSGALLLRNKKKRFG